MILKTTNLCFIKIHKTHLYQRIDNFLIKKFKNIPKSKLYNIIRRGKIRINKKRVKPKYKLKIGDIVKIPPLKIQKVNSRKKKIDKKYCKIILKNTLYEDKHILIINKISGISVHGGSGINFGIIEILRLLKPQEKYLELIHRLDRYTSGILMIAKKKSSLLYFHKKFREKNIQKEYIAIVHGNVFFKKKTVNNFLLKKNVLNKKKIVIVNNTGKLSKTIFIKKKTTLNFSLISIVPCTGRMHQIRVHAAYIGHPIVFDDRYGKKFLDKKIMFNKNNNLLLHAKKITFIHPISKKKITISAPLDKKFKKIIKKLF
ncbi:RluA family pseudouridine synthase [Buchnera aphidicola]|uniref:RluA family pseudouridine synthase n=1 Tax=Buchnera aphidicola TaxID=9 RepID=UPI0020929383|nr:RluA family pseudouridine synthase [Buchnera aphidicola]USS94352.1 RluA family pseudouridine synthase [Buchnera aphidicola (Sipha maydis)]